MIYSPRRGLLRQCFPDFSIAIELKPVKFSRAFKAGAASQTGDGDPPPPGTWSHLWFAGVRKCPPWCSIVDATVTMYQFFCSLLVFIFITIYNGCGKQWTRRYDSWSLPQCDDLLFFYQAFSFNRKSNINAFLCAPNATSFHCSLK